MAVSIWDICEGGAGCGPIGVLNDWVAGGGGGAGAGGGGAGGGSCWDGEAALTGPGVPVRLCCCGASMSA